MSGERLSSTHPSEAEQEAARQAYEAWAASEAGHGQHLTSSIGSGSNGEKLAKLRQQLAAERGVPKFQAESSSSAADGVSKETAHSDEARGVHEADKTPDTHETINPRRQQEEEAVGETAVEAAEAHSDELLTSSSEAAESTHEQEREETTADAYNGMPKRLQQAMKASGRRRAMTEFGIDSYRQEVELRKTNPDRYQQFLDLAAQLTYRAADEYRQKVAPINKVKQEMGLSDNDKLSDLTVDRQIEAANQLSRVRDQQPRPSELRATSEAAHSSELEPSSDLA